MFDFSFLLRHDLEAMVKNKLPLIILTDSESLFKIIVKATTTTEQNLMVDVKATREEYQTG